MAPRKRERFFAAAWLGVVALAIQVLLPTLFAFEIKLAGAQETIGVFSDCAYGHRHLTALQGGTGKASDAPGHHDGVGSPCPICIALLASPPFTAPPEISLRLPVAAIVEALAALEAAAPTASIAVAYRSRAPPIV